MALILLMLVMVLVKKFLIIMMPKETHQIVNYFQMTNRIAMFVKIIIIFLKVIVVLMENTGILLIRLVKVFKPTRILVIVKSGVTLKQINANSVM